MADTPQPSSQLSTTDQEALAGDPSVTETAFAALETRQNAEPQTPPSSESPKEKPES